MVGSETCWQTDLIFRVKALVAGSIIKSTRVWRIEPIRVACATPSGLATRSNCQCITSAVATDLSAWQHIVLEALLKLGHFGTGRCDARGDELGDERTIRAHTHGVGTLVIGLPAAFEADHLTCLVGFHNVTPASGRGIVIVSSVLAAWAHGECRLSRLCKRAGSRVRTAACAWRCRHVLKGAVRTIVLSVHERNLRARVRVRKVAVPEGGGERGSGNDGLEHHVFAF